MIVAASLGAPYPRLDADPAYRREIIDHPRGRIFLYLRR